MKDTRHNIDLVPVKNPGATVTAQDAELLREAADKIVELVVSSELVLALLGKGAAPEVQESFAQSRKLASDVHRLASRLLPPGTLCKLGEPVHRNKKCGSCGAWKYNEVCTLVNQSMRSERRACEAWRSR